MVHAGVVRDGGWAAAERGGNLVIGAMSVLERAALEADLRILPLASGKVLYEPYEAIEWVWFPRTAVLSVITVMADGRTVESATVGRESVVGALAALGSGLSTSRTLCQVAGEAMRYPAAALRRRVEASPALRDLLLRHAEANLAQAHQSVACNALHRTEARLARWLLTSQDRTEDDKVRLTQQFLAIMVGVQRSTLSEALAALLAEGFVRTGRGFVEILDRPGLEARACECYEAVRDSLDLLTGHSPEGLRERA